MSVVNELWHYRYVGKEAAQEIYSQGICLEEYIQGLAWLLQINKMVGGDIGWNDRNSNEKD